ncbi:MAG: pilus assembly protein PilM, partial [Opitutales bacterium]
LVSLRLDYDLNDDESWLGAVRSALHELSHKHSFSGKAFVIIPGNQVLTKTIRIPHVEEAKRAQILAFEAQQNIPYPLHEVAWDSQVVGDDGIETEVLFIACKSNTISEICASVTAAGFIPERISAATVLEYNALRFAYSGSQEDILVVNIGARSTNLLFSSADGFFVRNIQLGGNTLTQSIADSLGKSFSQAEEIKHKFFTDDLDSGGEDSGTKLLQGCADTFIRRTSQEITRSIVNYRRQKNAAAPKQILLTGRGSLLRGLSEQLAASQKIKVDMLDPLHGVTLGDKITVEPAVLRLITSEIIGEAIRVMEADAAGVNLLPDELQAEIAFRRKKPFLIIAAACLALAPWPAFYSYKQVNEAYAEETQELQAQAAPLQSRQAGIREAEDLARAISNSIEQVEDLKNSKSNWIQFFAELQGSLMQAEDVWLDDLSAKREVATAENEEPTFEIELKGQMLVRETANGGEVDTEVLTRRIKLLQSSFESSEFVVNSRPPRINWESLNQGLNVLPFTISLMIDTSKTL